MAYDVEGDVIERAAAGDERAYARLVARWDGEVLNLAYRLTGSAEDARDVRQAAFIRAFEGLGTFDGRSRFSTWLFRIVVNLCRDHHRRRRSRERHIDTARRLAALRPVADGGPDERAVSEEAGRRVACAVGALPAAEREVLVLRHYQQLTMPEVARLLDIPVTTARSRLTRALGRLREALAPDEPVCSERG